MKNSYTFKIRKPLHGTFVYLRKDYLEQTIRARLRVFVEIPQGRAEINPERWLVNGTQRKQIFLRPNEPMDLVGGYVPIKMPIAISPKKLPESVVETDPQMSLFDKPKRRRIKDMPPLKI